MDGAIIAVTICLLAGAVLGLWMWTSNLPPRREHGELITKEEIDFAVRQIGHEISAAIPHDEPLVMICVLKGSVVFFADLIRQVPRKISIDFIQCSSYGEGKQSSGAVAFLKMWQEELTDKHVVIVDDIYDTGTTMEAIKTQIRMKHKPLSIRTCALIKREGPKTADFYAVELSKDHWIYGYGLDLDGQYYRNLPSIYRVDKDSE